jgi:hypothetical protein
VKVTRIASFSSTVTFSVMGAGGGLTAGAPCVMTGVELAEADAAVAGAEAEP